MTTEPGFPKNVCIQIHHLPSGNTYQSDDEKVYDQEGLNDFDNVCKTFTNTDAVNCLVPINKIHTYFPVGVLQQSIIRLIVKPV